MLNAVIRLGLTFCSSSNDKTVFDEFDKTVFDEFDKTVFDEFDKTVFDEFDGCT